MRREEDSPPGYCLLQMIKDQTGQVIDHRVLKVNSAFEKLTGLTCDQIEGKSIQELVQFIAPDLLQRFPGLENIKEPYSLELYSKAQECWFIAQLIPVEQENKIIILFIRQQKDEEKNFHVIKQKCFETISSSSVGSFFHDLEKGEIYYSNEWKKRLGLEHHSPKEALSAFSSCVHPDDLPVIQNAFMKACENKDARVQVDFRAKTIDSGYIWILGQAKIVYNQDGKPIKYFGTHLDINERKCRELNAAFYAEFGEKIQSLSSVDNLLQFAGEKIKCHFHADRVLFGEVDENRELKFTVHGDLDSIKPNFLDNNDEAAPHERITMNAVSVDSSLNAYAEMLKHQNFSSQIFTPFIDNKSMRFFIVLQNCQSRQWRKDEMKLLEKLTIRICRCIQRIHFEEKINFQALMLSNVQEAIAAFDENMKIIHWNEIAEKLYGWTAEEALGSYTKDLFHTEIPGSSREEVLEKMLRDGSFSGEVIYYNKSGSPVYTDIHTKIIKGTDGEFKGGVSSFRDISDCKKAWEALRQSESLLHSIIEGTTDPIFLKDCQGRVLLANSAMASAIGFKADGVTGKTADEFFTDTTLAEMSRQNDLIVMASNESHVFEEIVPTSNGHQTYLSTKTPWHDEDGNVQGLICIARNISVRKEMEEKLKSIAEELKQKNEVITEFFTNISHELKTPLALILNQLELIRMFINEPEKVGEFVDIAVKNSFRLTRLINNLLDITKIEAGFTKASYTYSDIVSFIYEICDSIKSYAASKSIELNFKTNLTRKIMPVDIEKMERILLNLLSNAIKFTDQGGKINVKVLEKKEGNIVLIVEDTGKGIPKEYQDTIFDRFSQVQTSMQKNTDGCGIGLALVKSLVEILNGNIRVESQLGKGSRFIVDLPVIDLSAKINQTQIRQYNLSLKTAVEFSELN